MNRIILGTNIKAYCIELQEQVLYFIFYKIHTINTAKLNTITVIVFSLAVFM